MGGFHTKRSPSQAERFLACAGYFAMVDSLPEHQRAGSNSAAQLGTATHGLIEKCLREGKSPEEFRGRITELVGATEDFTILRRGAKFPESPRIAFEVDDYMIDGAEIAIEYVRARCAELGVAEEALHLETRTNPLPERDDASGTADVTIDAWPELLEVIDYKNGLVVVEHENNPQLLTYLLGKAIEDKFSHESYRITVAQPNASHSEGHIRSFEVTEDQLRQFQTELRAAVHRCEQAEAEFGAPQWAEKWLKAGKHCTYCPARIICPASHALAQQEARIDFADDPCEITPAKSVEEVARILEWAPFLTAMVEAAETYAQRSLEAGFNVPGFKLVRRRSTRKFREDLSEPELVKAILKGGYITDESALYTPAKLISGPQAEKLVPKKQRAEFSETFLVKPKGGLTVAPESDPREKVENDAIDDFL